MEFTFAWRQTCQPASRTRQESCLAVSGAPSVSDCRAGEANGDEQTNRRLDDTSKRLEEALDIRERLAALEARMVPRG